MITRLRHWVEETLPWWIAYRLPRRVALFALVRVYAVLGTCGPDYRAVYERWVSGDGS